MKKGQYIRLWVANSSDPQVSVPVAAATNVTLHVSAQVENSTTKDDVDSDWDVNEVVAYSFDIQSEALVPAATDPESDDATGLPELIATLSAFSDDTDHDALAFIIAEASGEMNRTQGSDICGGYLVPQSVTITAANKQNSTVQASFAGYGELNVGS